MTEVNKWKSAVDELISSIFQSQNNENDVKIEQCQQRAFKLLYQIKDSGSVENHKFVISTTNALRWRFDLINDSESNHNVDTNPDNITNKEEEIHASFHLIAEMLRSKSIAEKHKVSIIQFINLILSRFSIDNESNLNQAKSVYDSLRIEGDHEEYFRNNDSCEISAHAHDQSKSITHGLDDDNNNKLLSDPFWNQLLQVMQQPCFSQVNQQTNTNGRKVASDSYNRRDVGTDAKSIKAAGDFVAENMYSGAQFLSRGLAFFIPKVTEGIENFGAFAKQNIEPSSSLAETYDEVEEKSTNEENYIDSNEDDQAVAITAASVEATDVFRESAQTVAFGIRDYSTRGINILAKQWEEKEIGQELCPEHELRESLVFAGKVSMATLGASVNLAESILDATKAGMCACAL